MSYGAVFSSSRRVARPFEIATEIGGGCQIAEEAIPNRGQAALAQRWRDLILPIGGPGDRGAVDRLQAINQILAAGDDAGEFVGAVLLLPGNQIDHPQKCDEIPFQQGPDHDVHDAQNRNPRQLSYRAYIFEDTHHRGLSFVHPGP